MADETRRLDDADDAGTADATLAIAARHALHDEELVVALAVGSLDEDGEVERAQSLVDRCTACRELNADIAAIGTAVRMDARGTMAAPRDFRISVEDARRLGGPVSVGGMLGALRRAMQGVAPQLGASMAAIGVVGLLVSSIALGGGAASAPTAAGTGQTDITGAPGALSGTGQGPKASDRSAEYGPLATEFARESGTPSTIDSASLDTNPAAWLLGGSVALLIAGVALLLIAFRRRRTGDSRTRDS